VVVEVEKDQHLDNLVRNVRHVLVFRFASLPKLASGIEHWE